MRSRHNTEQRGVLLRCDAPESGRCHVCRLTMLADICRQLIADTYLAEHRDVIAVDVEVEKCFVTTLSAGDYQLAGVVENNDNIRPRGSINVSNLDDHSVAIFRCVATLAA